MDQKEYIGLDVHQASTSVAVRDAAGKLVTESIIETKATTILEFVRGIRGSLWVTFEEGTRAAWLYDLLKPHVTRVIVCNPRKNALLNAGSKSDRVDARKLSDLRACRDVAFTRRIRAGNHTITSIVILNWERTERHFARSLGALRE